MNKNVEKYLEKNDLMLIKESRVCRDCNNANIGIYRTRKKRPLLFKVVGDNMRYSYRAVCPNCGSCGSAIFDDDTDIKEIEFRLLNRMFFEITEDGGVKFSHSF